MPNYELVSVLGKIHLREKQQQKKIRFKHKIFHFFKAFFFKFNQIFQTKSNVLINKNNSKINPVINPRLFWNRLIVKFKKKE